MNPYHHAIETLAEALAVKQMQADEYLAKSAGSSPDARDAARRLTLLNEQIDHHQNAMVLLQTAPLPTTSTGDPQVAPTGGPHVG